MPPYPTSPDPVEDFYRRVNAQAEKDMQSGSPAADAHQRALEAEIAEYHKTVKDRWHKSFYESIVSEDETRKRMVQALRDARSESTS